MHSRHWAIKGKQNPHGLIVHKGNQIFKYWLLRNDVKVVFSKKVTFHLPRENQDDSNYVRKQQWTESRNQSICKGKSLFKDKWV